MKIVALAIVFTGCTLGGAFWALISLCAPTPFFALWLMVINMAFAAMALAAFWVRFFTKSQYTGLRRPR